MSQSQIIFGFHPIISQLRQSSRSIQEIYLDSDRNDPRAKEIIELAKENKLYQSISKSQNISEAKAESILSTILEISKTLRCKTLQYKTI